MRLVLNVYDYDFQIYKILDGWRHGGRQNILTDPSIT